MRVEAMEMQTVFRARSMEVSGVMIRSRIGLPYLVSPIWKNGVSRVASMKFPAE